jgi:hypothetical protein
MTGRDEAGVGNEQRAAEAKIVSDLTQTLIEPRPKTTRVRG